MPPPICAARTGGTNGVRRQYRKAATVPTACFRIRHAILRRNSVRRCKSAGRLKKGFALLAVAGAVRQGSRGRCPHTAAPAADSAEQAENGAVWLRFAAAASAVASCFAPQRRPRPVAGFGSRRGRLKTGKPDTAVFRPAATASAGKRYRARCRSVPTKRGNFPAATRRRQCRATPGRWIVGRRREGGAPSGRFPQPRRTANLPRCPTAHADCRNGVCAAFAPPKRPHGVRRG